jgi:hypothetical protein
MIAENLLRSAGPAGLAVDQGSQRAIWMAIVVASLIMLGLVALSPSLRWLPAANQPLPPVAG